MYEQIKVESSVPRRGETILVAEVAYPPFGEGRWGGASLPEGGVRDPLTGTPRRGPVRGAGDLIYKGGGPTKIRS